MTQGQRSMPILPAISVGDSVAFFVDGLGFDLAGSWNDEAGVESFAIVRMDAVTVGIAKSERSGSGEDWAAYVYLKDVATFVDQVQGNGVRVVRGPEDSFYFCREVEVEDPNGNRLCFAQDLKPSDGGPGL